MNTRDDKHPYLSPTTPGLYVTFRDYVIELVCLHVNPKIGPRFWKDNKYWGPKYKREIRGVSNLKKEFNFDDPHIQTAIINVITEYRIKALVAHKTLEKVVRLVRKKLEQTHDRYTAILSSGLPQQNIDNGKNSTFVDTGESNILSKIRKIENG